MSSASDAQGEKKPRKWKRKNSGKRRFDTRRKRDAIVAGKSFHLVDPPHPPR